MTEQKPRDSVRRVYFTEEMPFTSYDSVRVTGITFATGGNIGFELLSGKDDYQNRRVTVPSDKIKCIV